MPWTRGGASRRPRYDRVTMRSPCLSTRAARALLLAALSAQFLALVGLGRFPASDESFYKAAGREWAASGRFAAPELEGFSGTRPGLEDVFFVYPPLYPFFFGLVVRAVGFGWRACVAYDAAIHALLALSVAWLARRRLPEAPEALALGAAALVVPLGTWGRPDELGLCFALAGLGLLEGASATRVALAASGFAFGLAAGTSPAVAAMLGAQAALTLLRPRAGAAARLLAWGACAALTAALAIAPLLLAHPDAWRQALGQSVLQERLGRLTLPLEGWRPAWTQLAFTLTLLAIGLAARAARLVDWREWAARWLVPTVALAAVVVTLPGKHTYLWMWGAWLLVAAVECAWRAWHARRRRLAASLSAALLAGCALAAAPAVQRGLVIVALPADQRPDAAAARVRAAIPPGARVLVDELWWSTAGDYDVRDVAWSRPSDPASIEWLVLSGNGTGAPGRARALPPHLAQLEPRFEVVRDDLSQSPASLLGLRISRSGWGFGVRVLRRQPVSQ